MFENKATNSSAEQPKEELESSQNAEIETQSSESNLNVNQAVKKANEKKAENKEQLKKASEKIGTKITNSPEIKEKVGRQYQEIMAKIGNQELLIKLTEDLKTELPETADNSSNMPTKVEAVETNSDLTSETLKNILHSFDLSITVEGVGDIEIPEETESELLTAVLEGKKDFKITDSEYLKQQLKKPNSAESRILLKGYQEISQKIEVKPEEKGLIKELVWTLEAPYKDFANNENLQNIISRKFDISKNKDKITLIDQTDPTKEIADPKKTIQEFLGKEFPINSDQRPKNLVENLKAKDGLQGKAVENIKSQITEMQEGSDGGNDSWWNQLRDLIVLFKEFFSGEFNVDKVDGMWKKLKLDKNKSDTNEFSMSYREGEEITEQNVYAIMKGKEVTVTNGKKKENITITDPENQIKDIKIEDGKVRFAVVGVVVAEGQATVAEKTEKTEEKLSLDTIDGAEAMKAKVKEINESKSVKIGKMNGKDLNLQLQQWIQIDSFEIKNNIITIGSNEIWKANIKIDVSKNPNFNVESWTAYLNQFDQNIVTHFNSATNTIELSKKEVPAKQKDETSKSNLVKKSENVEQKNQSKEEMQAFLDKNKHNFNFTDTLITKPSFIAQNQDTNQAKWEQWKKEA